MKALKVRLFWASVLALSGVVTSGASTLLARVPARRPAARPHARAALPAKKLARTGPLLVGWHDEMNNVDQWAPLPAPNNAAVAAPTPGLMELSLAPKPAGFPYSFQWGGVRQIATVNLDRYPVMAVQSVRVGPHSYWDVGVGLVKPGGEVVPKLRSKGETKGGLQFVDAGAAGLKGEQQLEIRLHVGGSLHGYEVADYGWVRFIRRQDEARLKSDPDLQNVRLDAGSPRVAASPVVPGIKGVAPPGMVSGVTIAQIGTFTGHKGPVGVGIQFSPDGKLLASSAEDGSVIVWNIPSGTIVKVLPGHLPVGGTAVSFSPDGKLLAAPGADGNVKLWNTSDWSLRKELPGGASPLAFAPEGGELAAYRPSDASLQIWNVNSGAVERVIPAPASSPLLSAEPSSPLIEAICYSPDGSKLATAGADGVVRIWSPRSGVLLSTLRGHIGGVRCLRFSGDGRWLASAGEDQVVRLWPMDGGTPRVLGYPRRLIGSAAFSRDGSVIVAGTERQILFWRTADGEPLGLVNASGDWINALAFSPDGTMLAAGSRDHTVLLWRYSEIRF